MPRPLLFLGDLSQADAAEIVHLVREVEGPIVEFGSGGSTHLVAQVADADRAVWSLDTDPVWIDRCRVRGAMLGIAMDRVRFATWERGQLLPGPGRVGFAFCDGRDDLRLAFCACVWPRLLVGGVLVLHDALRDQDIGGILSFLCGAWSEVSSIKVGPGESNLAVVVKGPVQTQRNWRGEESLEPWEWGGEDPPADVLDRTAGRTTRWPI